MDQRLSLITLGVADTARSNAFYEALGWRGQTPDGDVRFFQAGSMIVALWGRADLAADSVVTDAGGWGGIDAGLQHAVTGGGRRRAGGGRGRRRDDRTARRRDRVGRLLGHLLRPGRPRVGGGPQPLTWTITDDGADPVRAAESGIEHGLAGRRRSSRSRSTAPASASGRWWGSGGCSEPSAHGGQDLGEQHGLPVGSAHGPGPPVDADDRAVVEQHLVGREPRDRRRRRSRSRGGGPRPSARRAGSVCGAADRVDDDVDAAARELPGPGLEVLRLVGDHRRRRPIAVAASSFSALDAAAITSAPSARGRRRSRRDRRRRRRRGPARSRPRLDRGAAGEGEPAPCSSDWASAAARAATARRARR